ncbi:hypothetical protein [Kitasatospora camelliae]|uniref:Uncharacterized protein n=1 Tax=Kitasatospora camelliae TaxID=3156397 RepID=A0AAU8JVJ4_9ACTN
MSKNRSRRIDRATAEQLLSGAEVGSEAGPAPLTGHAALAGLLAAAAAPAADGELPGEREAVAAFREARRTPVPQPRRRTMADTAMARAFSAKALVAAFAVTAVGGVAVAAGTGSLPAALGGGPDRDTPAAAGTSGSPNRSHPASGDPSARTTGPGSVAPYGGPTTDPGAASAGPADLPALCRTFTERTGSGAKAKDLLAEPALQPLVKAAGTAERVQGYCNGLGKKDTASPTPDHGGDGHNPSATPTKAERTEKPGPSATPSPSTGRDSRSNGSPDGTAKG